MCDLIADDGNTLVLPMATTLQHYNVGEQLPRGRPRTHRLPANVADTLTELKMTKEIRRSILGAIPISKRAILENRAIRKASAGKLGPAAAEKSETAIPGYQEPGDRQKANRKQGPPGPPGRTDGAGKGRAENDGGRGSRVPRRGFSK